MPGECGKNNNSNPCEHICLDLHDGTYECSCFYGFTLTVDGYSCAKLATTTTMSSSIKFTLAPSTPFDKNANKLELDYYQLLDDNYYNQSQEGDKQVLVVVDNHNSLANVHNQQISNDVNGLDSSEFTTITNLKTIPRIANDNRKLAEELARGKRPGKEISTRTTITTAPVFQHNYSKEQQRTFTKNARFNTKHHSQHYQSLKGILRRGGQKMSNDKRILPANDEDSTTNLIRMRSEIPDLNNNNNNNNNRNQERSTKGKLNELKLLFFVHCGI